MNVLRLRKSHHHWSTIGDPLSLETTIDVSLKTPKIFIGDTELFLGALRFSLETPKIWKSWGLQRISEVSNEKLGSPNEILGVFNENMGSPMKIWGSPLSNNNLQQKPGSPNEILGVSNEILGVSNENLEVSNENLGGSNENLGVSNESFFPVFYFYFCLSHTMCVKSSFMFIFNIIFKFFNFFGIINWLMKKRFVVTLKEFVFALWFVNLWSAFGGVDF